MNIISLEQLDHGLIGMFQPKLAIQVGANPNPMSLNAKHTDLELIVVDFDPARIDAFKAQMPPQSPVQCLLQLVAEIDAPVTLHHATNPQESGLISAEALQPYWRNLKTTRTEMREAFSLNRLAANLAVKPDWLWVDSLSALSITQGATDLLPQLRTIMARVILDENAPPNTSLSGLQNFLRAHGFALLGVQPERNPALGTAIFIRDYFKLASERQNTLDDIKTQLDAETKAKLDAIAARDAQTKLANERQIALDDIKTQLEQERQAKGVEFEFREKTMHDELVKAEAQIELIKELIFKGPQI